ncbi:MAG: peptidase S41, partial [Flavobacteriales bacterium]|nr:peptidase S41 [Flavobacteriales bacterium]
TGYIKLVRFARTTHEEFLQAADDLLSRGMKRLVLDLRGNGGGYLNSAIDLADEFLPEGRMIVYTEGRHSPRRDFRSSDRGLLEDMPLAVLIDEGSASASEILAGAVQDNDRGLVVGRRTFGKGLVQEHVDLPDQSAVRLTTARYYTPSGRSIQRPYGEGIDYLADFEDRFLHGELVNKDSVHQDTSEVFTTLKGRKVYGGGGIMPDIFVAADTAEGNAYLSALFFSGVLNQFAFDVADRERAALEAFGSSGAFDAGFRVDQALLEELKRFAAGQGVREEPSSEALRLAAERLKAGIARNIWGSSGFYEVLLDDDPIFQRARSEIGGA